MQLLSRQYEEHSLQSESLGIGGISDVVSINFPPCLAWPQFWSKVMHGQKNTDFYLIVWWFLMYLVHWNLLYKFNSFDRFLSKIDNTYDITNKLWKSNFDNFWPNLLKSNKVTVLCDQFVWWFLLNLVHWKLFNKLNSFSRFLYQNDKNWFLALQIYFENQILTDFDQTYSSQTK